MKYSFALVSLLMTFGLLVTNNSAEAAYQCRASGDEVCAVNTSTGQCTQSWNRRDGGDPMFFCKKFIGESSSNWNPGNYYCQDFGNYACAVSKRTGQCTNSWSRKDYTDPMFHCRAHLGQRPAPINKGNYYCRDMGGSVCAVNGATGQCTHSWRIGDGTSSRQAMNACQIWLTR